MRMAPNHLSISIRTWVLKERRESAGSSGLDWRINTAGTRSAAPGARQHKRARERSDMLGELLVCKHERSRRAQTRRHAASGRVCGYHVEAGSKVGLLQELGGEKLTAGDLLTDPNPNHQ